MRIARRLPLLLAFTVAACASAPQLKLNEGAAYARGNLCSVEVRDFEWVDASRQREVPARLYLPRCPGPHSLIVFSHGLANSRERYAHFGRYWASHGYAVAHVQHHGSDRTELETHGPLGIYRSAKDRKHWRDRPLDVTFAIDQIALLNEADPTLDIDTENVGVAGHSYGAFTAFVTAGMTIDVGDGDIRSFPDRRVRAIIGISSPILRDAVKMHAYDKVEVPVLHLTGSRDRSLLFRTTVADRSVPFRNMAHTDSMLVTLQDAGHSSFSDDERRPSRNRSTHVRMMQEITLAFWDATIRHDPRATEWIAGGITTFLGDAAQLERHAKQ
jgi:predicted dienelactone hydrolase